MGLCIAKWTSNFQRTKIVTTTSWQRVPVSWTPLGGAQYYLEVGVDLRDGSQTAQPAQTVYIWGAQMIQDVSERTYIPTTSAAATQGQTYSCPSPIQFRDFSSLANYSGNPVIPQNAGLDNHRPHRHRPIWSEHAQERSLSSARRIRVPGSLFQPSSIQKLE